MRYWSVQLEPSQYRSCPSASPGLGYHPAGESPVAGGALAGDAPEGFTTGTFPSMMNSPKVGSAACSPGVLSGVAGIGPVEPGTP